MAENQKIEKLDNISNINAVIVLRSLLAENVTPKAIVCPYAEDDDEIDGKRVSTCGLIRVPLMETDIVTTPRITVDKHGHSREVCDVYLSQTKYMCYYTREYITDFDNNRVKPTNDGHYGDWIDTFELVEKMKHGKSVINKARRLDALQAEEKLLEKEKKFALANHEAKVHDLSEGIAANILSVDFSK